MPLARELQSWPTLIQAIQVEQTVYENTQYGFRFTLPDSWKGYTIVTHNWKGQDGTDGKVVESGASIGIRHPAWTADKPRQDIPIFVFTIDQWNAIQQEKLFIGAAPMGPSELTRNDNYVFALPARYNFAYLDGYQEVEDILKGNPPKLGRERVQYNGCGDRPAALLAWSVGGDGAFLWREVVT